MTDDNRTTFQKMADDLRRMADEVKLKVHLGGMEAKDAWAKLEPKVQKFEAESQKVSVTMGDEITAGLEKLGTDVKEQLGKLRDKLGLDAKKP